MKNLINRILEITESREKKILNLLKKDDKDLLKNFFYLNSINEDLFLKAYFVEKDIEKAKQYCYISGKMYVYSMLLDTWKIHKISEGVAFLLLSDNEKLIKNFSFIKEESYEKDIKEFLNFGYCIQAVLRNDIEHLKELNNYTKYNIENRRGWKRYIGDYLFFEAYINNDEKGMEDAIYLLANKWHKRRYDMPLFNELISLPALTYTKLCYIKGIKLNVKHKFIPEDLLEIKPNKEYIDYDFMNEEIYKKADNIYKYNKIERENIIKDLDILVKEYKKIEKLKNDKEAEKYRLEQINIEGSFENVMQKLREKEKNTTSSFIQKIKNKFKI